MKEILSDPITNQKPMEKSLKLITFHFIQPNELELMTKLRKMRLKFRIKRDSFKLDRGSSKLIMNPFLGISLKLSKHFTLNTKKSSGIGKSIIPPRNLARFTCKRRNKVPYFMNMEDHGWVMQERGIKEKLGFKMVL